MQTKVDTLSPISEFLAKVLIDLVKPVSGNCRGILDFMIQFEGCRWLSIVGDQKNFFAIVSFIWIEIVS